jgi:hypothetical protein
MQSDNSSPCISQESLSSLPPNIPPMGDVFSITREDAAILAEYVEEFQEGDTDLRNTIIANVMAELFVLRPDTVPFNKVDASKVAIHIIIFKVIHMANILLRRSESGSTTIILSQRDSM